MIQAADLTVLAGLVQKQQAASKVLAAMVAGDALAPVGADEPGKGSLVDVVA